MPKAQLIPFDPVDSQELEVHWRLLTKSLRLSYALSGKIQSLIVPEISQSPSRLEGLYHHTCFELFLSLGEKYLEWNFSPSGDWCTYAFESYRKPAKSPEDLKLEPLQFSLSHLDQKLVLEVEIPFGASLFGKAIPERIGISSVLENENGQFSYWALKHSTKKPDFNLPENWCPSTFQPER